MIRRSNIKFLIYELLHSPRGSRNNIFGIDTDSTIRTYRTWISPIMRIFVRLSNNNQARIRAHCHAQDDTGNILRQI